MTLLNSTIGNLFLIIFVKQFLFTLKYLFIFNEQIEIMNKTVGDLEFVHYLCSVHYK